MQRNYFLLEYSWKEMTFHALIKPCPPQRNERNFKEILIS
jgi:hypothetical protein